jgi:hypothetical protein
MNTIEEIVVVVLPLVMAIGGYFAAPIMLVWSWVHWARRTKLWGTPAILSSNRTRACYGFCSPRDLCDSLLKLAGRGFHDALRQPRLPWLPTSEVFGVLE